MARTKSQPQNPESDSKTLSTKPKKKTKSRGLGDTVKNILEATGIAAVVEAVTEAVGIEDCGCGKRQEALNSMFPYGQDDPDNQIRYTEHNGQRVRVFD